MIEYPKRLIEVDLPIKEISAHARREKSIRHGHISTLHIWWARRPLAACRAVTCAALWPDPADDLCPQEFRDRATKILLDFAETARTDRTVAELTAKHRQRWNRLSAGSWKPKNPASWADMRYALLDFIADFANWDASTVPAFLETSRALTQAAHEALGGEPGTRPLVVDPFAGGGSIPLEALRVGADAFASDLNPVAVLLNKVVLEYIPKYGQRLADEVRKWGEWIKKEAEKELAEFYPKDPDGATPIAYLWARTIRCEGPGCGTEVPLIRALWLSKKSTRMTAMKLVSHPSKRRVDIEIVSPLKPSDVGRGTVARGSATCPCCGYTTRVESVRKQLKVRHGGADEARLLVVVTTRPGQIGRFYRLPAKWDFAAVAAAQKELKRRKAEHTGPLSLVPEEPSPQGGGSGAGRAFSQRNYGMDRFCDLFTSRQLLSLTTLSRLVVQLGQQVRRNEELGFAEAVNMLLGIGVSRLADRCSAVCRWDPTPTASGIINTFSRQALPIIWDFAEGLPFEQKSGGWQPTLEWVAKVAEFIPLFGTSGTIERAVATAHPLPDDSAKAFITDPPYYDAVPYADLSDFFYVWLKRALPSIDVDELTPKAEECIVDEVKGKDKAYFERTMAQAMAEGRRVLTPDGVGVVVFAHKSTSGWEAQLQAMVDAGWVMTGSWPIDTEMGTRLRAMNSAALASSVHLVCRPRENPDGSIRTDDIGDWRDVLAELPKRIHEWMPRLANEGVVGADAIFACLGPALEIFSQYSRVEKTSGEVVTLKEYLEHVWAAVAREALSTVLGDTDSGSLEPDARLSVIWLWTIGAASSVGASPANGGGNDETAAEDEEASSNGKGKGGGFVLEFDAARKIAQGLGAKLEELTHTVEVKGDKARLLPAAERMDYLFGKKTGMPTAKTAKKRKQLEMFALAEDPAVEQAWGEIGAPSVGRTTLDRVHQAMLLFASGRGEALKRFLVEEGIGKQAPFWKLAQSLSALYPAGTDEKRWVDGVLARKKGLGF